MSFNNKLSDNNPVWNAQTTTLGYGTTLGGMTAVPVGGSYFIISNIGAANINVGNSAVMPGILLEPGSKFESAVSSDAVINVYGTATVAQGFTVLWFN